MGEIARDRNKFPFFLTEDTFVFKRSYFVFLNFDFKYTMFLKNLYWNISVTIYFYLANDEHGDLDAKNAKTHVNKNDWCAHTILQVIYLPINLVKLWVVYPKPVFVSRTLFFFYFVVFLERCAGNTRTINWISIDLYKNKLYWSNVTGFHNYA